MYDLTHPLFLVYKHALTHVIAHTTRPTHIFIFCSTPLIRNCCVKYVTFLYTEKFKRKCEQAKALKVALTITKIVSHLM